MIKSKVEINEVETKRIIQIISKTKSWFFEKINKTHKSLAKLIKRERTSKLVKLEMKREI
jgi:dissimilatory sulfite reductase (desulfoviridin) alpha/beta subunit